jgi:PKD domain-containing protein
LAGREVSHRRLATWVGAVFAVVFFIASGADAKTFGGVVPDVPTGAHVHRPPSARIANLPYGGGPVLHSNRTHVIFWAPSHSGLGYDPGYQAQITTFLARVAADSRRPTNVYGLSGQYHDSGGPAAYDSQYAGAVVASDRLPGNGCTQPSTGPGWSVCLSDQQLGAELEKVIRAHHLPTTGRDVYFLAMPYGLGSCEFTGPDNCALGGAAAGSYCGYHSANPDQTFLYAIIPYNAVPGHCQSGNPRPNASTADPTLSTLSHEHNETVTDPLGDAWVDPSTRMEDGDLCITQYGPSLGGSPLSAWDEVIHGGHYYLQEEWSNEDGSCQPRDESYPIWFSAPARIAAHKSQSFTAHGRDPDGSIKAYAWFFGDRRSGHGRVTKHAFTRAGSYKVVLRTTDRSGNWAFDARAITVTKARR